MSIVTNVIRDLGIIGSHLPRIAEFKLIFRRASAPNIGVGRSEAWASPEAAEQFQRNQLTSKAVSESMARLHVAR